jgi:hypothetical protein
MLMIYPKIKNIKIWKITLVIISVCFLFQAKHALSDTDVVVIDENSLDTKDFEEFIANNGYIPDLEKQLDLSFNDTQQVNDLEKKSLNSNADHLKDLIIGSNIKTGMSVKLTINTLGFPDSFKVERGINSKQDRVSMTYLKHGLIVHVINEKKRIDLIEILPQFKGKFSKGVKLGDSVGTLVKKFGTPKSIDSSSVNYPRKGIYFKIQDNILFSARNISNN